MATIRSLQHPNVKRLYTLRRDKEVREEEGLCLVYSTTLIREIGRKGALQELWIPEGQEVPRGLNPLKVVTTTKEVIRKVTGLKSASEMVGVFRLPKEAKRLRGDRLLLLDRVADPGNLGTLTRTALAFGWEGVYFVEGCVDPFNDKALRASRGALFRLPYQKGSVERALESYPKHQLLVADPRGKPVKKTTQPLFLALGNEATGPSERLMEYGQRIAIPISPKMESLNVAVAGGILLYVLGGYGKG